MDFTRIDDYLDNHLSQSISELAELCAQPSVSAQGWGLDECAKLVATLFERRGFRVEVYDTGGAPILYAERKGRSDKTILFYNHYDVQPAEPLELWSTPPFVPTVRDGKLFARGSSDDKGHIISRLFAIDALLEAENELPCRVKFLIEGEEEISSPHLHGFVENHADMLAADGCIWEFGGVDQRDFPMQYLGLRGICYVELSVETANQDVHSGIGGSIFPNAAWRLVWALSSLKGMDERILIPGFYDAVCPPTQREIELMEALPETSDEYKRQYGVRNFLKGLTGGVALRLAEAFEPSCTICGLTAGYQGEGLKTILPYRASAKVDFRLVPNQTPEEVVKMLRLHLDSQGFGDVRINFLGGEAPAKTDPDDPFVQLVIETAQDVDGPKMQMLPMVGGSGPNYIISRLFKVPIVPAGIGHPTANAHAPDENVRLDLYLKGAKHIARVLKAMETK